MAAPVFIIASKAAAVLTDERARNGAGKVILCVLSPVIGIMILFTGLLSGAASHNENAVQLVFSGREPPSGLPAEYREFIQGMGHDFAVLEECMDEISGMMEGEDDDFDRIQVKSVYYALYSVKLPGELSEDEARAFVNNFVTYETHTRDEVQEDGTVTEEEYQVAVPLINENMIYQNLQTSVGGISGNCLVNATEIYWRIKYGTAAPTEGDMFGSWEGWSGGGMTAEEYEQLCKDLPEGNAGAEALNAAMTRLGDPYSQAKRGEGNYTDCSYLTMWAYRKQGISIPGTAAEQAKFCADRELLVSKDHLAPGDLVFWSFKTNGRYRDITHVGIYAGNGNVVDASSSKGKVVYRAMFSSGNQVMYGRPALLGKQ